MWVFCLGLFFTVYQEIYYFVLWFFIFKFSVKQPGWLRHWGRWRAVLSTSHKKSKKLASWNKCCFRNHSNFTKWNSNILMLIKERQTKSCANMKCWQVAPLELVGAVLLFRNGDSRTGPGNNWRPVFGRRGINVYLLSPDSYFCLMSYRRSIFCYKSPAFCHIRIGENRILSACVAELVWVWVRVGANTFSSAEAKHAYWLSSLSN